MRYYAAYFTDEDDPKQSGYYVFDEADRGAQVAADDSINGPYANWSEAVDRAAILNHQTQKGNR